MTEPTGSERMRTADVRVYLGTASWRAPQAEHASCVERLLLGYGNLVKLPAVGDALIDRARSKIATRFLRSDAEVLLTIDDDIVFDPGDALTICGAAVDHDVVCGMYATRGTPETGGQLAGMLLQDRPTEFVPGQHRLAEILWGASGFMATHRRVFEKLVEDGLPLVHQHDPNGDSFYPFYLHGTLEDFDDGETIELSEDYAFCNRARDAGFTIYADTGVHLGHLGSYCYELGDLVAGPKYRGRLRFTRERRNNLKREWDAPVEDATQALGLVLPDSVTRQQRRFAERHPDRAGLALVR